MVITSLELIDYQRADLEAQIAGLLAWLRDLDDQWATTSNREAVQVEQHNVQAQLEEAQRTLADLENQRRDLEIAELQSQLHHFLREAAEFQQLADQLNPDIRMLERQLDRLREQQAEFYVLSVDRQHSARTIQTRLSDFGAR
jgi:chromosome segregation ATPase